MTPERHYIEALIHAAGKVELRVIGQHVFSGVFNNPDRLEDAAHLADGQGGVYTTLNQIRDGVKVTNILRQVRHTLGNDDISRIVRIPFDFDPTRPKNSPSNRAELAHAEDAMQKCLEYLTSLGWAEPIIGMSGNGYHLQYRVDLPNEPLTNTLLDKVYEALSRQFDSPEVSFDVKVRNPGRILRLYGTTNIKGNESEDRPHRLSWCRMPDNLAKVSLGQLQALADTLPIPSPKHTQKVDSVSFIGSGDYNTLDVVSWFTAHGNYLRPLGSYKGAGRHAVKCPWGEEHSDIQSNDDTSTIIFEPNLGWPGFHCSHDHCEGRKIKDVMAFWGDADTYCAM